MRISAPRLLPSNDRDDYFAIAKENGYPIELTFCDVRKCRELSSLSHLSFVGRQKQRKANRGRGRKVSRRRYRLPDVFSREKKRSQLLHWSGGKNFLNVFMFGILSVNEIRTIPFNQQTPVHAVRCAAQCKCDKIESTSSRFYD